MFKEITRKLRDKQNMETTESSDGEDDSDNETIFESWKRLCSEGSCTKEDKVHLLSSTGKKQKSNAKFSYESSEKQQEKSVLFKMDDMSGSNVIYDGLILPSE